MAAACQTGGGDEPTPAGIDEPEPPPLEALRLGSDVPAHRRATPTGPWEGHGLAWLEKLGGSPRDFPGPAGFIASSGSGLRPTLELAAPGSGDLCSLTTAAPLGIATRLDVGACEESGCEAALVRELSRGAALVILDGATEREASSAARLAEAAAEATQVTRTLFHAAVPSPLALHGEGFWRAALEAELLRWPTDVWTETPHRLLLSNGVARALGRRGLLVLPRAAESHDAAAELARVGLHLASGGATLVESELSRPLTAAIQFAADHPELFARHRSPVALIVPVDSLLRGDAAAQELDAKLVGLARIITEAGFPLEPVLIGGSDLLPVRFVPERLSRAALVVVPGSSGISETHWSQLAEGAQGGPVLFLDDEETSPLPDPPSAHRFETRAVGPVGTLSSVGRGELPDVVSRWRRRLDRQDEQLTDTARRSDGAVDGGNLPPRVLTLPSWSPEAGSIVQHLVDLGALRGEGPLQLDDGLRLGMPVHGAQHARRCSATLHLPDRGLSEVGECKTKAGDTSMWASFPGRTELPSWSIVEVRLDWSERPELYGVEPIRLQAATGPWAAPTLVFEVPFLDEDQVFSLSLPEFLRVDDPPENFDGDLASWQTTAVVAADRRSGTFRAESTGWVFEADIRTETNRVDLSLRFENRSSRGVSGAEALLCASSRGATPFPESGHGRTWIQTSDGRRRLDELPLDSGDPLYLYRRDLAAPVVTMESVDRQWLFGHAFDSSAVAGGNGSSNGVCLHSRPVFGDLRPGASASRSGMLFLGRAGDLRVPEGWSPTAPASPIAKEGTRMPCDAASGAPGGAP